MTQSSSTSSSTSLPTRFSMRLIYIISMIIVLLMVGISLVSVLNPDAVYPTEEYVQNFVPNDVVILVIGVPIMLLSMWLAGRGRLIGLLFWPGALFFGVYNYLTYVFSMPLGWAYLVYLALMALCLYTMVALLAGINSPAVGQQLHGRVPEKFAGAVLVVLAAGFLLRAAAGLVNGISSQVGLPATELALLATDFLVAPAWIIGGILLWRKEAFGYTAGTGLLFQASMLFIGLIMFMLVSPFISGITYPVVDIVLVIAFSLVCLVPFALYVRGVIKSQ